MSQREDIPNLGVDGWMEPSTVKEARDWRLLHRCGSLCLHQAYTSADGRNDVPPGPCPFERTPTQPRQNGPDLRRNPTPTPEGLLPRPTRTGLRRPREPHPDRFPRCLLRCTATEAEPLNCTTAGAPFISPLQRNAVASLQARMAPGSARHGVTFSQSRRETLR